MRKLKLLLASVALLFGGGISVSAQTDVTSTYITNADFSGEYTVEKYPTSNKDRAIYKPTGWDISFTNVSQWNMTAINSSSLQASTFNNAGDLYKVSSGSQYMARFRDNQTSENIDLSQTVNLPKGAYTLSAELIRQDATKALVELYVGSTYKQNDNNEKWETISIDFTNNSSQETKIGIKFSNKGAGGNIAGAKNVTLQYKNINGPKLSVLIAYATNLNSKIGTLTSYIADAQAVFDGINNTPAYQATIDDAITTLQEAINTKVLAYSYNAAGDDVTCLVFRPGFEGMTAESANYATVKGKDYSSEGWTMVETGDWGYGAIMSYGSDKTFNGASVPATDNAGNTGNTLGISVGWGCTQRYQSEVITLPAGSYRLSIKAYNANSDAQQFTSKFGFVPTSGDPSLSTKTSFASNTWETDEVDFVLASNTEGRFQIGGTAVSGGSGSNAKIFFDNISLTYFDPLKLAQIQWQETWDALDALDETALPDAAETAITDALSAAEPTTVDGYNTAKAALQALIDSYDGIKAAYDKALALIDLTTDEKTNSTGTKTTIEAAINTATTDIETRTTAAALDEDYNTLETARQTYVTSGAQPTADHVFDYTFKIADAAVTSATDWTNKRTNSGQQYTGAPDNTYFDTYNENRNIQKNIGALRLGKYELKCATRADVGVTIGNIYVSQNGANLNQTNINHAGNTGGDLGNGWSWTTVNFDNYEDSKDITLGFYSECGSNKWAGADDFHLYYKGNVVDDETAGALTATVVSGKMNATVASTQVTALSNFESAQTFENYNALKAAINDASASKTAYTKLKGELDKMDATFGALVTNIYSPTDYATNYTDVKDSYDSGSITTDDANDYEYGKRVTGAMPAIMLSSWKVGETAALTDASLYMNAWSTEGNSDGSEMSIPFYEYWVNDANALEEKTFTAIVEGLTPGTNYLVSAKVRVRQQNDQTKADDDVTFQVNDGDVVNAADGTQSAIRSEVYYKTVRAFGDADGDGKLTIKVVVKDGNHINWLAFKDVHYSVVSAPTDAHKTALNTALADAEAKVIGFAAGEYAPYTNIDACKALAAAKAIDVDVNTDYEVVAATTALTGSTWNENAEEMNAVSDELFNGTEYGTAGWTRTQTWNNTGTGIYSVPAGTMTYGDVAYHEMPLEGNTVYKLTFGHRRWDGGNADNGGQVSVLNGSGEGLAFTSYTGTSEQSLQNEYYYFRTGAAGNYTFTVTATSGRLTFGNVVLKKAVIENVTIAETDETAPAHKYADVTLTRTLSASYWNTFSVPFDAAIPDGWTVKEFDSATDNVISFKNATSFVAGKPYLVSVTADVENPTFNNVIVKNTEGSTDGEGVYKFAAQIFNKSLATDGTIAYLATDGKIKKLTSGGLKGLRAYFIIPASGASARINFIDDETTGISRIENSELRIENSVYNLQGQRVNKAQKGLYIKNGKKVVKK